MNNSTLFCYLGGLLLLSPFVYADVSPNATLVADELVQVVSSPTVSMAAAKQDEANTPVIESNAPTEVLDAGVDSEPAIANTDKDVIELVPELNKEGAVLEPEDTTDEGMPEANEAADIVAEEEEIDPPFDITLTEAQRRLGLTDGTRNYDDETVHQIPASLPFSAYQFKSLFTRTDFEDEKLRQVSDVTLTWANIDNLDWTPKEGESLCNTSEAGDFSLTVSGVIDNNIELTKNYIISPKIGICFVRPTEMAVQGNDNYSDDFHPELGFKANAVNKFPTTGFKNATFDVVLNSPNNVFPLLYKITSSHQDRGVEAPETYGRSEIKLTDRPMGTVTLELLDVAGEVQDRYSFTIKQWFVNPGQGAYQWQDPKTKARPAEEVCDNLKLTHAYRLAARSELTNSKFAQFEATSMDNYFRRAINEGVLPEWGGVNAYPKTYWLNGFYWINEPRSEWDGYSILLKTGELSITRKYSKLAVICVSRK